MKYEDARFALQKLVSEILIAADGNTAGRRVVSRAAWSTVFDSDPALATESATSAAASSKGRAQLTAVYRIASEGTKAQAFQSPIQPSAVRLEADALGKWQVLVKSALLEAQAAKAPLALQGVSLSATSDVGAYKKMLRAAQRALEASFEKTPEQLQLAVDIKALGALPATGKGAAPAIEIIENWE